MGADYIDDEPIEAEVIKPVSLALLEQKISQLKVLVELHENALQKQMAVIKSQRDLIDIYETREASRIENLSNRG